MQAYKLRLRHGAHAMTHMPWHAALRLHNPVLRHLRQQDTNTVTSFRLISTARLSPAAYQRCSLQRVSMVA